MTPYPENNTPAQDLANQFDQVGSWGSIHDSEEFQKVTPINLRKIDRLHWDSNLDRIVEIPRRIQRLIDRTSAIAQKREADKRIPAEEHRAFETALEEFYAVAAPFCICLQYEAGIGEAPTYTAYFQLIEED